MKLLPGDTGWDYSFNPPLVYATKFVFRYLSGVGKMLTTNELYRLNRAGVGVGLVMETSAQAALNGYATGRHQALVADEARGYLGISPTANISFAIDWDVTAAQMLGKVAEFYRGVFSVLSPTQVGIYGGYRAIDMAPPGLGFYWQTYAWSNGRVHEKTHLYQYKNGAVMNGGLVDLNRVRRPFEVHPHHIDQSSNRLGVEMIGLYNGSDEMWYGDGIHCRWIKNPSSVAALKAAGAVELPRFATKAEMHRTIGQIDVTTPAAPVYIN